MRLHPPTAALSGWSATRKQLVLRDADPSRKGETSGFNWSLADYTNQCVKDPAGTEGALIVTSTPATSSTKRVFPRPTFNAFQGTGRSRSCAGTYGAPTSSTMLRWPPFFAANSTQLCQYRCPSMSIID